MGHILTWEKGRQLKSFDGNTYTYNANGIRTSKTVNGVKHTYTLDGTKILRETWDDTEIIPLYDNEDSVCGLYYEGLGFYFLKNLQGDIIAITDEYGKTIAKYAYDAWGKCTIVEDTSNCNIATLNPYRYRGYYYDPEIEMYYLQSRYYDPVVGRFINADYAGFMSCFAKADAYDLYAYCDNSPVDMADFGGKKAQKLYSGIVGFGLQIMFSASVLAHQGFVGAEALWFAFTKNNNLGNGLTPWAYWFYGGSIGLTLDFSKIFSKSFLNNPKTYLSGLGLGFSLSISVAFFLITARGMKSPNDYTREFSFQTATVWGVTVSEAYGSNISTYGVGFTWEVGASFRKGISIGKKLFGGTKGDSFYYAIKLGKNAKDLYRLVEGKV